MARKSVARKNEEEKINDIISGFNTSILSKIKIDIKHKNETQKTLTNSIKTNDVTICTGPPGCGKTYLTCAQSLIELKQDKNINKIVLVKSVTTLKSEEIGFLKGTLEEKMEPFMYSFIKNFEKIVGREIIETLKAEKIIEILPIAYMRGVNIDNAIIIVDEAQNISVDNIRTILTRLGENSKMILLGDLNQIDQKNKYDSALMFLTKHFKNIDKIDVVEFGLEDIVRHPLIKQIEPIFELYHNTKPKQKEDIKTTKINYKETKISFFKKIINKFFKNY